MSKLAAQRAMREANYAARQAAGSAPRRAAEPAVAPEAGDGTPRSRTAAAPARAKAQEPPKASSASEEQPCGHTSMNGRRCTREAGHSQKSHRYS